MNTLPIQEIKARLMNHFCCAQIVLSACADELGYDEEELAKMAAGFCGGMQQGETCGVVTAAMVALGIAFGNERPGDPEQKKILREAQATFMHQFLEKHGALRCKELIGYDFSQPGQQKEALESGKLLGICPGLIQDSEAILAELLEDM